MSKKKKWMIIGIIVVCLAALIWAVIIYQRKKDEKFRLTHSVHCYKDDINSMHYLEFDQNGEGFCMVAADKHSLILGKNNAFNGKYILLQDWDYVLGHDKNDMVINKLDFSIYDLETREFIKTIDLKAILECYAPESVWLDNYYFVQGEGGEVLFKIYAGDWTWGFGQVKKEIIYINLVTDEVTVLDAGEVSNNSIDGKEERSRFAIGYFKDWYDMGLMKKMGCRKI